MSFLELLRGQCPTAEQHTGSGCVFKMWVKAQCAAGKKSALLSVVFEHLKLHVCCLCELTRVSKWCLWEGQLPPASLCICTSALGQYGKHSMERQRKSPARWEAEAGHSRLLAPRDTREQICQGLSLLFQ